jgi:hypothetical protein
MSYYEPPTCLFCSVVFVVGLLVFLLLVTLGILHPPSKGRDYAPTLPTSVYKGIERASWKNPEVTITKEEFEEATKGKSPFEVRFAIGEPDRKAEKTDLLDWYEIWEYHNKVKEDGKELRASIKFTRDKEWEKKVTRIYFTPLREEEINNARN